MIPKLDFGTLVNLSSMIFDVVQIFIMKKAQQGHVTPMAQAGQPDAASTTQGINIQARVGQAVYALAAAKLPDNEAYFARLLAKLDPDKQLRLIELFNSPQMAPHMESVRYIVPLSAVLFNQQCPQDPKGDEEAVKVLEAIADAKSTNGGTGAVDDRFNMAKAMGLIVPIHTDHHWMVQKLTDIGTAIKNNAPQWYGELAQDFQTAAGRVNTAADKLNNFAATTRAKMKARRRK